ncbi:hypothetical protein [Thiobacter aerophilum]|uniref:MSHA biogenesis protein MshK n=1 Tax=Thiobacter aerophilum TaxID=3121275 RepID=A0ABV0EFJ8_9BURK
MAFRLMVWLMLVAVPAGAADLPDPTRPALAPEGAPAGSLPTAFNPRVQMIRLAPGRASALVDGREVTVGSRLGEQRVVRITEGEVVLKGPEGTEVLKLFAEVDKRPVAGKAAPVARKKSDAPASRKAQP